MKPSMQVGGEHVVKKRTALRAQKKLFYGAGNSFRGGVGKSSIYRLLFERKAPTFRATNYVLKKYFVIKHRCFFATTCFTCPNTGIFLIVLVRGSSSASITPGSSTLST